jgi:hypothetical protein
LAIRLLDGSKLYTQAEASGTVQEVVEYVDTERTDGGGRYVLKCRFPDRTLTSQHSSLSMADIGLVPSGTLFLCAPTKTERSLAFGVAASPPVVAALTGASGGGRFFLWVWMSGLINWLTGLVGLSAARIGGQAAGTVGTEAPVMRDSDSRPAAAAAAAPAGVRGGVRGGVRTLNDTKDSSGESNAKTTKKNEYFGGDSTVFQGRDDEQDQ